MDKEQQAKLLSEIMQADEKDGLYEPNDGSLTPYSDSPSVGLTVNNTKSTQTTIFKNETVQTAVDWLEKEVSNQLGTNDLLQYLFKKAKEIEMRQIRKAYKDYHDLGHIYGLDTEQYYNETYESNTRI